MEPGWSNAQLSDAGGPARPKLRAARSARIRSNDLVERSRFMTTQGSPGFQGRQWVSLSFSKNASNP